VADFSFTTIGTIHSCFREKFGIPRQSGLATEAEATLQLLPPYNRPEAVAGLEGFSHIWITFIFHAVKREAWKATVRPPRLGGNRRMGVFASRSTHRPNPIGLSVVELDHIDTANGGVILHLKGVDLLDGTPVLDIKPYLPYADALPDATGGYAATAPEQKLAVLFSEQADNSLARLNGQQPDLRKLIKQLLSLDPRPAYTEQDDTGRVYGMRLYDVDVKWQMVESGVVQVVSIESEKNSH
jgi:tRNA-Thr(GGU) m(6)t(6)A37 methyltransferase TsaA